MTLLGCIAEMKKGTLAVARRWYERALAVAVDAGLDFEAGSATGLVVGALLLGPEHLAECERVLRETLERWEGNRRLQFEVGWRLGVVLIRRGRVEEGRTLVESALSLADEMGWEDDAKSNALFWQASWAERYADPEQAEFRLQQLVTARVYTPGHSRSELASVLCDLGRAADALELVEGEPDPTYGLQARVRWRSARARALSRLGGSEHECVPFAREAARLADGVDRLDLQADARVDLAEVLLSFGRVEDGRRALQEAERLYERKGIPAYERLLRLQAQAAQELNGAPAA